MGIAKSQLSRANGNFDKHMKRFAGDIEDAFSECHVDVLCLCELGEHEEGLDDQGALLDELVQMVTSDAPELAGTVCVLTASHPTYAVITRSRPSLTISDIQFARGLDPARTHRLDRTALVLAAEFQGRPLTIVNVHCPANGLSLIHI